MKNTNIPSVDKVHLKGVSLLERHPIIPNMLSISDALRLLALRKAERYVVDCEGLRVKAGEMKADTMLLAKAFVRLGVKPGDIVACAMPNTYQALLVFMAANTIGAVTTYLNSHAGKEEIADYLNLYECKLLLTVKGSERRLQFYKENTGLEHIIMQENEDRDSRDFRKTAADEKAFFMDLHGMGAVADLQKGSFRKHFPGKQNALILHTSGSTGMPKSMMFTNENVIAALTYLEHSTHTPGPTKKDCRWMNVVPFMYPYGFVASALGTLFARRELILIPDVNAAGIGDYYEKKSHLIFGSPAFLELTMKYLPDHVSCEDLRIYVSGGDFLSEKKSREGIEFFAKHGATVELANGSGNGEILACCTNSMNVEYKPETVGQLVLGPDYRVIDTDTGAEVPYDEPGVLCVAGKHVFQGYFKDEAGTAAVMKCIDGKMYYNTGNYGILRKNRYFELVGRASRFYIVSSLNKVYCELVQKVLCLVDVVDSCVVVPKPHEELLYVGKAYIKLKDGVPATEEMAKYILEECKKSFVDEASGEELQLKEYEIPAELAFVEEIKRHDDSDKIAYEYYRLEAEKEVGEK